jgi:hypothetical protein
MGFDTSLVIVFEAWMGTIEYTMCRRRLPESFYYVSICHEHRNLRSFSIKFWKIHFMCRSYGGIVQNTCVEAGPWTRMVFSKVNIVVSFQVQQKKILFFKCQNFRKLRSLLVRIFLNYCLLKLNFFYRHCLWV